APATTAYVSLWGGGGIAVIDWYAGTVTTRLIPTGKNPTGMALSAGGERLFVVNGDDDSLSAIRLEDGHVDTVPLAAEQLLPGLSPSDVALSPDGERVYVAAAGANAVFAFDARS